jgi:putative FmdB family regulatory protein
MPLYDYKCTTCQKVTEVRHGFGENFTEPCPQCGGTLSRVFNPAPIVFKGSGFYVTDSRGKSQTPAKDAPAKETPAKEEAKPAKETSAKETPAKDPAA